MVFVEDGDGWRGESLIVGVGGVKRGGPGGGKKVGKEGMGGIVFVFGMMRVLIMFI